MSRTKLNKEALGLTCFASIMLSSVLGIPRDANKAFGSRDVVLFSIDDRDSAGSLCNSVISFEQV
jgi:hypothetical protein